MFSNFETFYVLYSTSGRGKYITPTGGETEKIHLAKTFASQSEAKEFKEKHDSFSFKPLYVSAHYNF